MEHRHFSTVREWHFHTYFDEHDYAAVDRALEFRETILKQSFVARCLPVNLGPRGPHPCGSFETWVPAESFVAAFAFFTQNRGSFDVFVHALTELEVLDHEQGSWMGNKKVLDLSVLKQEYPSVPLQYPELGLGYSAKVMK
jgi:DOPA 4,5-dioxygenase